MLEPLGLTQIEESVYERVLTQPASSAARIASALRISTEQVTAALEGLEARGLLRRYGERSEVVPLGPDGALDELVAEAELEAAKRRREAARIRRRISPLLSEYVRQQSAEHGHRLRRVPTPEQFYLSVAELTVMAHRTLQVLNPPTCPGPELMGSILSHNLKALERGVQVQLVFAMGATANVERWRYARRLAGAGAEGRLASRVPTHLLLVDRRVAAIPENPDRDDCAAVIVSGTGLVATLSAVFEHTWQEASPLPATPAGPADDDGWEPLSDAERDLKTFR